MRWAPIVLLLSRAACGGQAVVAAIDAALDAPSSNYGPANAASHDAQSCFLDPSGFDPSCTQDTDCMAAAFGDVCTDACRFSCNLGGTAINARDSAQYNATLATKGPWPSGPGCSCGTGNGVGWEGSAAYCEGGQCVGGYRPLGDH